MNTRITIRKKLFYTAGQKCWASHPELGNIGVGVSQESIKGEGILTIHAKIEGDTYKIDKQTAREFVEAHQSFYTVRWGKQLAVIPISLCKEIEHRTRAIKPILQANEAQPRLI